MHLQDERSDVAPLGLLADERAAEPRLQKDRERARWEARKVQLARRRGAEARDGLQRLLRPKCRTEPVMRDAAARGCGECGVGKEPAAVRAAREAHAERALQRRDAVHVHQGGPERPDLRKGRGVSD